MVALLTTVALADSAPALADPCPFADAQAGTVSKPQLRRATLCLVNRERARRGMRRLRPNRRLRLAGTRHAHDMVRRRYFAHTSPSGASFSTWIRRTGYIRGTRRCRMGENIAYGARSGSIPRNVVRAWLRSSAHRRNMLDPRWREVGVGIVRGTPFGERLSGATHAMEFGRRWR